MLKIDIIFDSYSRSLSIIATLVVIVLFSTLDQMTWAAVIICANTAPVCNGTSGDDLIFGNGQNQVVHGLNGNDYVRGDRVRTNYLFGDDGNDILIGGYANDGLYAGRGNDKIDGWSGDDTINEEEASDGVTGTLVNNDDVISGGYGNDFIKSGEGVDRIERRTW